MLLHTYKARIFLLPSISTVAGQASNHQSFEAGNGNALGFLYGHCCKPSAAGDSGSLGPTASPPRPSESRLSPKICSASKSPQGKFFSQITVTGRRHFGAEIGVPEGLSNHVASSRKAQANWYKKLLVAWRIKSTSRTPEEASRLVVQTLKKHHKADVEGFWHSGLPLYTLVETAAEVPVGLPQGEV
ncbi:hypothetical protein NL676_005087 [Syzygium grande]|nr:hypothetical protein NL676_005087 [Syzygium grande]